MSVTVAGGLYKHITVDNLKYKSDQGVITLCDLTPPFLAAFNDWIEWVNRPVNIHGMGRSPEFNKRVGGIAKSGHLRTIAVDFDIPNIDYSEKFVKYAKKWKQITKKYKLNGEAGLYKWGFHFGVQTYYNGFYNWDSRSGKQKNMFFKI